LPVENNIILRGRIDQVNSLGRNDVEIVDYKTGKPKKDSDAQKDLQLSIYAIAAKEIFEWIPSARFSLLAGQSTARNQSRRKAARRGATCRPRNGGGYSRWGISREASYICRNCAYKPICPAHEGR